jgi:hypothetical protein
METNSAHCPLKKQYVKKINAVPMAKFTEFLLDLNSVRMCVRTSAKSCACASTDEC